jgi:phosphotriesterase-related protein
MILPHEHIFVDLRTWDQPGYGEADIAEVIALMSPLIEDIKRQGITAMVEPGPIGVGRRADILLAVSRATDFPVVAPTGVYREPWLPPRIREMDETGIANLFIGELIGEIESTGVQAGWIKVGASDDGVTEAEAKVLRAAARASLATGAAIGSHTIRGEVARSQVGIIESVGGRADRFVWIHAHNEHDLAIHREMASRGVWLEYDGIGPPEKDDEFIRLIMATIEAGYIDHILLSQDRGWFDPAKPGGGSPMPYTYLADSFLPKLAAAGLDDRSIEQIMRINPFNAFAR